MAKLKIKDVAKEMGISQQALRIALQRGIFPFGKAIKMTGKYTYYINSVLFEKYMRGELK